MKIQIRNLRYSRLEICATTAAAAGASQRGIALVIVMIAIFVLAVLAGGFAYSMKVETKLARNANSETELEWLGRSGVEYARWVLMQQLSCPYEPYIALNQVWAGGSGGICATNGALADVQREVRLGNGSFSWKLTDLERKWNINIASDVILGQAMTLLGVDASQSTPIVNSILDWIDPDDNPRIEGTESDFYERLTPPYDAKNGPIDDLSELLLVHGVTQDMYWGPSSTNHPAAAFQEHAARAGQPLTALAYPVGLVDLFTPLSAGKVNINTASAEVLQLIPGVDARTAEAIVSARQGEDDGSGQTGPFRSVDPGYLFNRVPGLALPVARLIAQFGDVRSRTFEVQVEAQVGGYTRQFIGIIGCGMTPRDIQVLTFYWK